MRFIKYFLLVIIIVLGFLAKQSSAQTESCIYSIKSDVCQTGLSQSNDKNNCNINIDSTSVCCLSGKGNGDSYINTKSGACNDGYSRTAMSFCTSHLCCCPMQAPASTPKSTVSAEVTSLNFRPEVSIPGSVFNNASPVPLGHADTVDDKGIKTTTMSSDLLSKYIQALYNYGLAIVSILAALVLMGGGLLWLTSGGEGGRITKAKEMIIGSITGLIILFCAWIILNTVNPALLKLAPIKTVVITKLSYCCDSLKGNIMMDDKTRACPEKANSCSETEECTNAGIDSKGASTYKCVNKASYNCCEYSSGVYLKCEPKNWANKEACSTPKDFKWNTTYIGKYCAQKEQFGGTCLPACADKANGSVCAGIYKTDNAGKIIDMVVDCKCYNGIEYYGLGANAKEGDPCGNRKQTASHCYKLDDCSKHSPKLFKDHRVLGTTDTCGSGLQCCNPSQSD